MNAWHLLWIVPLASCIGFVFAAIFAAGSAADDAAEKRIDRPQGWPEKENPNV